MKWQSFLKNNQYVIIIILASIVFSEMISQLSFALIDVQTVALPWDFTVLLINGSFIPVLISIIVISVLTGTYFLWKRGGFERIASIGILVIIANSMIGTSLGLASFAQHYHFAMTNNPLLLYKLWGLVPEAYLHAFSTCIFLGNATFPILAAVLYMMRSYKSDSVLGNAHFASPLEIQKMKLWTKQGIIVGYKLGKPLRIGGFEGVLGVAPTGGGKTAAIAVPNLLEWEGSVIANDLKGELFELTAEKRKQLGNLCYNFAPARADLTTDQYNPFYYVSPDKNLLIRDLQLIAEILIPAERVGDGFWYTSSREVFIMLALYLLEKEEVTTLAAINNLSRIESFMEWLGYTVEERSIESKLFYQYANSLLNSDEKTHKNILKDFHSRMTLFSDPLVQNATNGNTFDFRLLRKQKMSIYINLPDADKERLKPILTLFWAQLINTMTQQTPDKTEPYPVLSLLDEFGVMARINKLKEGMAFLRAYHIRPIMLVQHLSQIFSVYEQHDAKSFLNAKVKIVFTLNDLDDAKFISQSLGNRTIKVMSHGTSQGQHSSSSQNMTVQSRPLMTPDEILKLDKNHVLVLIEGQPPIKAKKYYWFKHN